MGRPRRQISPEGFLFCPGCSTNVHISNFYTSKEGVWFVQENKDGTCEIFGRPMSRCKECVKHNYVRRDMRLQAERDEALQELERVKEELAKQGLELGYQKPDGTWVAIPLSD